MRFRSNFIARIARGVIAAIRIKLPLFASDPGQDAAFDAREIGADQHVTGRRNDHRAAAVADHGQRLRIQPGHVLIIAGRYRGDGGVNILDDRTLQVLRLVSFTGPAASGCAVVAKCAAHTMIRTGATKQRIDLLDGGLRAAEAKLQHPPYRRWQIFRFKLPLDRLTIELFRRAALILQPPY